MNNRLSAEQLPLDLPHQPSHLEDDFIEGEGNALALAHIRAWPDWPHPLTLLVGPPSSGKSHLAKIWADRANAHFAAPKDIDRLAEGKEAHPLVIDDVDRAGYAEAPLFHLVNRAIREGRSLLFTAREPVSAWPFATNDLKSRARLAAHFALVQSDDIQLSQMFVKLFGDRQIAVDPRVIAYLVKRMERSPEEAVILADITDRLALARGTAVTRSIAAAALAQRGFASADMDLEGDDDE